MTLIIYYDDGRIQVVNRVDDADFTDREYDHQIAVNADGIRGTFGLEMAVKVEVLLG